MAKAAKKEAVASKYWLNITLNKGKKTVSFGLPLDYFESNGNKAQKSFLKALQKLDAGKHELDWKLEASVNIIGEDTDDDDDDWEI